MLRPQHDREKHQEPNDKNQTRPPGQIKYKFQIQELTTDN